MENQHYDSHEAYVFALARELKQEYELIVAQGHLLQIDSPDLGIERAGYFQDEPLPKFIEAMEMHVAALNEALADIPPERVLLHNILTLRDLTERTRADTRLRQSEERFRSMTELSLPTE